MESFRVSAVGANMGGMMVRKASQRTLERGEREEKLKAVDEWFSMVESAGLIELRVEDLERQLNESIVRGWDKDL